MYSPRHARISCLPVRAVVGGGLTAVLLPIALAAPALATEVSPTATASPTSTSTATPTPGASSSTSPSPESSASGSSEPTATPTSAPATASPSPSSTAAAVADRDATSMRISASRIAQDGTSRIGVRLLSTDEQLAGETVAVEAPTATGWTVVARLTTDAEGLAVGHVPFSGDSRVRAVFAGTSSHASSTSPEIAVNRSATSMRLSASRIANDGTSRIGVRLLGGDQQLAGETVAIEAPGSSGWAVVARLTTDAEGLAVGNLPFSAETRVRAVFAETASHTSSTSPEAAVLHRTATEMRISASETGAGNRSRIGVRLLSGGQPVRGLPVAVEMLHDDGVWRYHGQATTDGEGLAVAHLPFGRDTRVRAGFSGSDTAKEGRSGEAVVKFNTLGEQAVRIAAEQQGKPYRYGATGPSSFDCSGYVTYIYKTRLGRNDIPRTSAQQEAYFPRVPQSAKRTGDLLFFRSGGRVSHVGVYAGDNKMWVSPSTGDRVKLQTIYTSSYTVGRVS